MTRPDRRRRWLLVLAAFGVLPAFLFSVVLVGAMAATDHEVVHTRADQKSIDLGQPIAWIHQNQAGYDPPVPSQMGLASPWENPTSVSGIAFVVDVLVVFTLVAVLLLIGCALLVGLSRLLRESRDQARAW